MFVIVGSTKCHVVHAAVSKPRRVKIWSVLNMYLDARSSAACGKNANPAVGFAACQVFALELKAEHLSQNERSGVKVLHRQGYRA